MRINTLDRPVRLPARIADALTREITEGRLKPGDRLPTEQYLAENFGVSRNVVREAIAQLRSAGLVVSRQGLGSVVAESGGEPERGFHFDMEAGGDANTYQHVYELRLAIEMQAADFAARRGDAAALREVSETYERMRDAERWETEGVDLDIQFHLAIARASGNPLMQDAISYLTGGMRQTIVATRERSGEVIGEVKRLTLDEHAAIRDAIVARDPDRARAAMLAHITNAAHRLGYDIFREDPAGR
jgi:GntR family transcriptional repressor for pyruvate dehydrogenase complex